jgi:hypothetical protein
VEGLDRRIRFSIRLLLGIELARKHVAYVLTFYTLLKVLFFPVVQSEFRLFYFRLNEIEEAKWLDMIHFLLSHP